MNLSCLRIYIPIILYSFVLLLVSNLLSVSYAIAPTIIRQNVIDDPLDWINTDTTTASAKGDPATDIVEVTSHFTNGRTFNSTIWLLFPFKEQPTGYSNFNYGMFIDSDVNANTGAHGVDYQLEIRWDNETDTWTRVLTEWSTVAVGGKILEETKNFTGFSGDGQFYVSIPIKLGEILYPNNFRVVYYAESQREGGPLITDFTKWINVPPPDIKLTTYPESVKMRPGENKTIELLINTSSSLEPEITLYSTYDTSRPILLFNTQNLTIPSNGFISIPVTIKTAIDTEVAPHTIPIYANATLPSLDYVSIPSSNSSQYKIIHLETKGVDKFSKSSLLVDVEAPLSLTDQVSEFWNKLGEPLSFLYGVVAGLSPTIYNLIKKKLGK
jgi:hypothetical protein